ncbi:hypothetical protein N8654_02095 [Synechococcus sp. AH-601-B19]|nr:hypothetical protein [Synechococcus sp. AH-601-B19]
MAKRDLQDRNYQSMGNKYKKNNSRDEFKGQKRAQAKSRARKAGDKEAAAAAGVTHRGKLGENSQFYQTNEKGKRTLTNIDEGANPFKVDNIQDFDTAAYGGGAAKGKEKLNMRDVAGLKSQGGFNAAQIQEYAQGLEASGVKIGKGAQKKLDKMQSRSEAKERAKQAKEKAPTTPATPPATTPATTPTTPPASAPSGPVNTTGDFGVGGDLTQNIGKTGDMTTNIGDGNEIIGSSIGNDYSVTIGNNNAGNTSGGSGGGSSAGLGNMMGAAAYSALNDNAHAKSKSQLNGTGGAAAAIALGEKATGATDRVSNLYNMVGASQNYWNDKATAQQGMYLGDIWNGGGYEWSKPQSPETTPDRTSEILNGDDDDD